MFFGGPFAALALAGMARFARQRLDLALGMVVAGVLLFTTLLPLTFVSRFEFRDPLTLCAIPLAGLMADCLLAQRAVGRLVGIILLTLQVGVVGAAASPFIEMMWTREARGATWFRGATGENEFVDNLQALMRTPGRIALASRLDAAVSEGERLQDGLGVNALAYRGLPLVNGSFKIISTDVFWPDDRLYYGRIRLPPQLIESRDALNALGIRYVLAYPGDAVAPGLLRLSPDPKTIGAPIIAYENESASHGVLILDDQALPTLPLYAGCANDRLLCRDMAPLAQLARPDRVAIDRQEARIAVGVDAESTPRLLVLIDMFRRGWVATADGRTLTAISVGPGLLGVRVPPGVKDVRLDYHAAWFTASTLAAWVALAGGLIALYFQASRRHHEPRQHTS